MVDEKSRCGIFGANKCLILTEDGDKMLYNIGDVLICKDDVNARCLEMSNPDFNIKCGDQYKVTDKDDFPDDHHCHWYELTFEKDKSIVLNAWNDPEHMIIDDSFEKV